VYGCCGSLKSRIYDVLPQGFLPFPIPFGHDEHGIVPLNREAGKESGFFGSLAQRLALRDLEPTCKNFWSIPFDYYCPSQEQDLESRFCQYCGLSVASKGARTLHLKVHKNRRLDIIEEENEIEIQEYVNNDLLSDNIYIIEDMNQWLTNL